jgi:hypothetical protein
MVDEAPDNRVSGLELRPVGAAWSRLLQDDEG